MNFPIRRYFTEVVAPFAIANQNCSVERDQPPEMERLANHSILDAFFDYILSFVREKSQDEVRQKNEINDYIYCFEQINTLNFPNKPVSYAWCRK